MRLSYAELSSPGAVRETNDDCVGFWQPENPQDRGTLGAVAAMADGISGPQGEVASRLAVETSIAAFQEAKGDLLPQQIMNRMFQKANRALFEMEGTHNRRGGRGAALCLVVLMKNELVVGNVGEARAYLVRGGKIRQLSTDYSYLGVQRKFGMIGEMSPETCSPRVVLNGVGEDPTIRVDLEQTHVRNGDLVVLCSDGLYLQVADLEISEAVSSLSPAQACRQLVALAERRGTDDNASVQVIAVSQVEKLPDSGAPASLEGTLKPSGYDLQPGQTLDERFYLTETINRSGMATIFQATDLTTGTKVAVKVPFMQFESDPGFYSRFLREEKIGLLLDHPYLLKFIPVENRSRPYLVTEYLHGYTLAQLLKSVAPLPEKDALTFASRICEALTHMHEHGVIHRDLKPQNIMVCPDGTLRILDFGIAKSTGRRFTFLGFTPAMGTPEYMAPEQVKGRRGDERTDIYTLGILLYQMVTGVIPFAAESGDVFVAMNARVTGDPAAPRQLNRGVSQQVEEIVLHAMERAPGARYPSARAMKAELDHPEAVLLTGRCQRLQRPVAWKRHWKNALLVGLSLATVGFGLVRLILLILRRGP